MVENRGDSFQERILKKFSRYKNFKKQNCNPLNAKHVKLLMVDKKCDINIQYLNQIRNSKSIPFNHYKKECYDN